MGDSQNSSANKASKNAVKSEKRSYVGFSTVSPSYSQLASGLNDIVNTYVASKVTSSSSTAKPPDPQKRTDASKRTDGECKDNKRKKDDVSVSFGSDDHNYLTEFLDRTKSDYFCKACDSHMNSEQMWENHVQGKRHLKNIKKDYTEPPSKVKAVRTDLTPKILTILDGVYDPVVGLDYMCELQRAESFLDPSYSCFLCHATCTISSVVDHILGAKHRMAYLKEVSPDEFTLVEEMKLKKSGLSSIAEDYAREYEQKRGRGRMEVKIEKPKSAPPSSRRDRDRRLPDEDSRDRLFGSSLSVWNKHGRDLYSPNPSRMSGSSQMPDYLHMTMSEKMNAMHQMVSNLTVMTESESQDVTSLINALTNSLLQYKMKFLSREMQDTLARHILKGDVKGLEHTLGLQGSGITNVGSLLNSMTASGDVAPRALGGGGGQGGGSHSSFDRLNIKNEEIDSFADSRSVNWGHSSFSRMGMGSEERQAPDDLRSMQREYPPFNKIMDMESAEIDLHINEKSEWNVNSRGMERGPASFGRMGRDEMSSSDAPRNMDWGHSSVGMMDMRGENNGNPRGREEDYPSFDMRDEGLNYMENQRGIEGDYTLFGRMGMEGGRGSSGDTRFAGRGTRMPSQPPLDEQPISYPTSHWHGGMGRGSFQGNDRSSLGY